MIEKFTEEELLMWETLQDPVALSECLFDDFDNLRSFEEDKFGHIRLGQLPLLSYEYLIDDENTDLSERENFRLREGAGNIWCNGGRLFGKSLIIEVLDLMITFLFYGGKSVGFTSYDHLHIKGILEKVIIGVENHPAYEFLKGKVNRNPYRIEVSNGCVMEGINMNLAGKRPGSSFLQKHFHKLFVEENTFETEEVNKKRVDSVSELGCVIRSAGMTTFTRYSPIGKIFYDLEMTSWVCNLPQTINPLWDEIKKKKAIKKHSGENSIGYRVFVEGEVVESGISVFDMERIRPNYLEKEIKHFEITKGTFHNFKNILILERPINADRIFICADIGESAPTEIIILSCVNDIYRYLYNITVYDLIDKEQFKIFEWLGNKLGANFIGIECTEGTGRAIYRRLEEVFPKENLVWYAGTEKIVIGFKKDENDKVIFKKNKPVEKEEFMSEWSVKRLKDLFYDKKIVCPKDFKLDSQLNSVISAQSGNRTIYDIASGEKHLFDAFKVFAIAEWMNGTNLTTSVKVDHYAGGV